MEVKRTDLGIGLTLTVRLLNANALSSCFFETVEVAPAITG